MLRKANIKDARMIQTLINRFAKDELMLERSLGQIYENLRDFWVYEKDGRVLGVVALHICWDNLGEIKSLAVDDSCQGKGIGTELVEACLLEARQLNLGRLFVLTYKPKFFEKFGFKQVDKSLLPHKVWSECIHCPKFPDCNEVAMIKEIAK
jgi:amino-acid N-acetyltransferase